MAVRTAAQARVLTRMVSCPDQTWTVELLARSLPAVSVNGIRASVLLLVGEGLVSLERGANVVSVRLLPDAPLILRSLLDTYDSRKVDL